MARGDYVTEMVNLVDLLVASKIPDFGSVGFKYLRHQL